MLGLLLSVDNASELSGHQVGISRRESRDIDIEADYESSVCIGVVRPHERVQWRTGQGQNSAVSDPNVSFYEGMEVREELENGVRDFLARIASQFERIIEIARAGESD